MTDPSPNPLADRAQRLALFQMWFSDTIPHSKALGIKIVDARRGFASMRLEWREELVGNPETGVLAGGPLTALLDGCCGMSVATLLKEPKPFATLDLRIDYVKPATPGQAGDCRGGVLPDHALGRLHPRLRPPRRAKDPIAAAAGTFMLGTKGEVTRPQSIGGWDQPSERELLERLAEVRKSGKVAQLAEAIPYARWMRIAPENGTGELLTRMRYHDDLIGNTFLPAIHGGTLGAMLEMAAIFHLLWETETETVPRSSTSPSTTCARRGRSMSSPRPR